VTGERLGMVRRTEAEKPHGIPRVEPAILRVQGKFLYFSPGRGLGVLHL
jgi:hypothetical protein